MTSVLPTVRMCAIPEDHNWQDCPHIAISSRTVGMSEILSREAVERVQGGAEFLLAQEMTINPVSDSSGILHMLPPACEFTVHVEHHATAMGHPARPMLEGGFFDLAGTAVEGDRYIAVLSSPRMDLDDLLAGSPEWTPERLQERLRALRAEREVTGAGTIAPPPAARVN